MTDEQQQPVEGLDDTDTSTQDTQISDDLPAHIASLEEQLTSAQDQVLRANAEMQNIRRRAEQDIEKTHKFALEKFASELLPIIDSLERGIELSSAEHESVVALREGMELTLKMFQDTLQRFQIETINPEGEIFNPDTQQAMAMEANNSVAPNTVLKVFQKGYLLNNRLLRPAMVVVSKA